MVCSMLYSDVVFLYHNTVLCSILFLPLVGQQQQTPLTIARQFTHRRGTDAGTSGSDVMKMMELLMQT